jgi:hypothetical protein
MSAPLTLEQERSILAALEARSETVAQISARLGLSGSAISKRQRWGIVHMRRRIQHIEDLQNSTT